MIAVQYPEPQFRIRKEGGGAYIFDGIRKSWLLLTEEEWVRQNFIQYLVAVLHYPAACMAVEKELELNGLRKRFDILVYDGQLQPWMLVECKAPEVALSEAVLQQALRYHMSIPVPYIVITNGRFTAAWKKDGGALEFLQALPAYNQ